jgi:HAD superfamily hydrolase (TIGR01459 family)
VNGNQKIDGLAEVADGYDTYLVDQWGVLHNGHNAFGPAVDVMSRLKDAGKSLIILSNSSRRAETTRRNMAQMAIDHSLFDTIATSGEEVWQALHKREDDFYRNLGHRCIVFQWGKDHDFFNGLDLDPTEDIEQAEFILLNGTERDKFPSYEPILCRAVERGLPMVCSNGDFVSITPEGQLVQCPGVLAQRYETLGGYVRWHGKPADGIYNTALDADLDRSRVLAIGDSLYHDIGGAASNGIDSLFITNGIHQPELANNRGLANLYQEYNATPTFVSSNLFW